MVTTTSPTSETFDFAYELQGSLQSGFTLQDDIPSTKKLVDPVAGTVKVVNPNGGSISLGQQIDVKSEGINIDPAFSIGNNYMFVSQANREGSRHYAFRHHHRKQDHR